MLPNTAATAAGAFGPAGGATYAVLGRQAVGAVPPELAGSPVGPQLLEAVRHRGRALEQQLLVQRAFLAPCADRPAVLRQLQLRALRECDLPDAAIGAVFLPAERHHGLVATAAAASAEESVGCEPPLGPATSHYFGNVLSPGNCQGGGAAASAASRCYERFHHVAPPLPPPPLTPMMAASWAGGGANFPPDVTLAHAARAVATAPPPQQQQQQQPTGQRVRREQGASSDEYEDTACIL